MKNKVLEFAKKDGFENIVKLDEKWNGYEVYTPVDSDGKLAYFGFVYYLVKNKSVRWADFDECEKITDAIMEKSDFFN